MRRCHERVRGRHASDACTERSSMPAGPQHGRCWRIVLRTTVLPTRVGIAYRLTLVIAHRLDCIDKARESWECRVQAAAPQ